MATAYHWVDAEEIKEGDYIACKWSEDSAWIAKTVADGSFEPDEERRVLAIRRHQRTVACYVVDPDMPERGAWWQRYDRTRAYLVTDERGRLGLRSE